MNHRKTQLGISPYSLRANAPLVTYLGCAILVLSAVICAPKPAVAHPHAWIDLRSTVVMDGNGRVIAIEQEWLFDEFYTLFVIEGASQEGADQKKALTDLADTNLKNLREYDYFTEVRVGGAKAKLGVVREFESELRNKRLWMRFVVPLAKPVDASAMQLSFAVYDPTYYVEVLYLKDDVIAFRGPSTNGCLGRIIAPTPTVDAVMLARALDQDAKPDNTLGRMFAERVEVSCR